MIIYAENITPRLKYICSFIFEERMNIEISFISSEKELQDVSQPAIVYGDEILEGYFCINAAGLILEDSIRQMKPECAGMAETAELFPVAKGNLSFDVFSACFYILSRYEEYLSFPEDVHGRFPASESLACKNGFLDWPVVNIWVEKLREKLSAFYPGMDFGKPTSSYLLSIDVDQAWDVRNKGLFRTLGGFARAFLNFNFKEINYRIAVLLGKWHDRFDTFSWISDNHSDNELIMFFLLADYSRYDKNIPPSDKEFKALVNKLSKRFKTGIHPSYFSSEKSEKNALEKARLEEFTGKDVIASRQHYLRLRFPSTYRHLINAGITEDYSMLFADLPGYRAGTSYPFRWYDLAKEQETSLMIFPPCIMERTLKDYMKLNRKEALELLLEFVDKTEAYGGCFIPIWHNDSVSGKGEWKGWDEVYREMHKQLKSLNLHD